MPAKRYRLPVGPRRSPENYCIARRNGDYLRYANAAPYTWSPRSMHAITFSSSKRAWDYVAEKFVSVVVARENGIRVEPK